MKFVTMYAIIISLLLPALCQAQTPLKYTDCGSHATISSIQTSSVELDSTGVHLFRIGQTYNTKIVFEPTENFPPSHTFNIVITRTFPGNTIPPVPSNHDLCTNGGIDCHQLHVGNIQTYSLDGIVPASPEVTLAVKWQLQDTTTNRDIVCFVYSAHVKSQ